MSCFPCFPESNAHETLDFTTNIIHIYQRICKLKCASFCASFNAPKKVAQFVTLFENLRSVIAVGVQTVEGGIVLVLC